MYKLKNQLRCKAQAKAKKAKQEQEQLVQIPWHELGNAGPNAVYILGENWIVNAGGKSK